MCGLRATLLVVLLAAPGCREDACRAGAPALQLDVTLPATVDGSRVANLAVAIDASGRHREQTLDVAGKLADSQTSIAVSLGGTAKGGAAVDVGVEARDASGHVLARGKGSYQVTGDACNFLGLKLADAADGGIDGSRGDAMARDATLDRRKDGTRNPDRVGLEGQSPDHAAKPDVAKPDVAKPDVAKPDVVAKPPDAFVNPCAGGAVLEGAVNNVAGCKGSAVTPCQATARCNAFAGWHLCTGQEYQARFPATGAAPPSYFQTAYIASCIRNGGAPISPTNAVCSSCSGNLSTLADVSWTCTGTGGSLSASYSYIAVSGSVACERIGINSAATAGYWQGGGAFGAHERVLCCR